MSSDTDKEAKVFSYQCLLFGAIIIIAGIVLNEKGKDIGLYIAGLGLALVATGSYVLYSLKK